MPASGSHQGSLRSLWKSTDDRRSSYPCAHYSHMTSLYDARVQRLTVIYQMLTEDVAGLTRGEEWQRMLAVAARFHSYRPSNILLITAQAPSPPGWPATGRGCHWADRVRKGERGIAILAPCVRRICDPDAVVRVTADVTAKPGGEAGRELARQLLGFRIVYVFDVSQTDGDPLPDVEPPAADRARAGRAVGPVDRGAVRGRIQRRTRRLPRRERLHRRHLPDRAGARGRRGIAGGEDSGPRGRTRPRRPRAPLPRRPPGHSYVRHGNRFAVVGFASPRFKREELLLAAPIAAPGMKQVSKCDLSGTWTLIAGVPR